MQITIKLGANEARIEEYRRDMDHVFISSTEPLPYACIKVVDGKDTGKWMRMTASAVAAYLKSGKDKGCEITIEGELPADIQAFMKA